ncbi:MAG TPA: competence protein CoiA family protein [Aggregatilineales bacterium]|nr:competence protein CoiA family protein [Aggregatilineales bacterium]
MTVTTLVALRTDTSQRVTIGDLSIDELRNLSDAGLLSCVHCGSPLRLKAGSVRLHHFAHVSLTACDAADHEPESEDHRAGKLLLYQHFRRNAGMATMEQHLSATDQRADVYVEAGAFRYALEFQQANNTVEHWTERHRMYRSAEMTDIWFLGQVRYHERDALRPISPYDPLPVPRRVYGASSGEFGIRELEKAILQVTTELLFLDPEAAIVTILLARDSAQGILHRNTLRAYCYQFPLANCVLHNGALWTPLDPLLQDYRHLTRARA